MKNGRESIQSKYIEVMLHPTPSPKSFDKHSDRTLYQAKKESLLIHIIDVIRFDLELLNRLLQYSKVLADDLGIVVQCAAIVKGPTVHRR
jgi:hypothetical protein